MDGDYFRNGTLASTWFPFVKFDDFLEELLVEEAAQLGKYGALTLLSAAPDCPILVKSANLPS